MKQIDYVMLNPSQNLTGLVTTHIPAEMRLHVSNLLLQPTYIGAEQIGFITYPTEGLAKVRLNMPNNEFCGDGVLAVAAYAKWSGLVSENNFNLEVSGSSGTFLAEVWAIEENDYYAKVEIPNKYNSKRMEVEVNGQIISGTLIELPGISHFIVHSEDVNGSREMIIDLVKKITLQHKAEAYGVVTYEYHLQNIRMIPCIYIPNSGKLMFESACGSGTIALGLFLATSNEESLQASIIQPGGALDIEVEIEPLDSEPKFKVSKIILGGSVKITNKGTAFVSEL